MPTTYHYHFVPVLPYQYLFDQSSCASVNLAVMYCSPCSDEV